MEATAILCDITRIRATYYGTIGFFFKSDAKVLNFSLKDMWLNTVKS